MLHTLGCRLNQAETLALRDLLASHGYEVAAPGEKAALAIINTCSVTRLATAKCRQVIRQIIAENPRAYIAVIGCYSQTGAAELATIDGIDLILGNQDKMRLLDHIGTGEKNTTPAIVLERITKDDFSIAPSNPRPFDKRANLKVQDGCNLACSFCIIPRARGTARSRNFDNLMDEATALATRGVRELVLTGVNLGAYASGKHTLTHAIDALAQIHGIKRIRISSIEPATMPAPLLQRMADTAHPLQPHLHLPLQSGCERILRDMRRKYSRDEYATLARAAAAKVPGLCLGTDIMVGFPGETDAEFEETCAFFQSLPFAYAHVFTYSERDGTTAARRTDQVPIPTRQRRSAHLRRLSAERQHAFHTAHLGHTVQVLFEDAANGMWPGYTGNYIRIAIPTAQTPGQNLANHLGLVRIDTAHPRHATGTWLGET
jgi:threonylcarbamoyladenosine tRNA methylthiotransferase MtaB